MIFITPFPTRYNVNEETRTGRKLRHQKFISQISSLLPANKDSTLISFLFIVYLLYLVFILLFIVDRFYIYIYIYIYLFIGKVATVSNQRQLYILFFSKENTKYLKNS